MKIINEVKGDWRSLDAVVFGYVFELASDSDIDFYIKTNEAGGAVRIRDGLLKNFSPCLKVKVYPNSEVIIR